MTIKVKAKEHIGWKEWLGLPDFGIERIKAKIDTGAMTSSVHAIDVKRYRHHGKDMVSFSIIIHQRSKEVARKVHAELIDERRVKSSNGQSEFRPVILTHIKLFDSVWPIEMTLANRSMMGFRMLLGRNAIKGRFLIDPSKSFVAGKVRKKASKAERKKSRS